MEGWAPILEWGLQHWGLQWREWGAERSPAPRWKPGPAGASFQVQSGLANARAPASATLTPCPQALGLALRLLCWRQILEGYCTLILRHFSLIFLFQMDL